MTATTAHQASQAHPTLYDQVSSTPAGHEVDVLIGMQRHHTLTRQEAMVLAHITRDTRVNVHDLHAQYGRSCVGHLMRALAGTCVITVDEDHGTVTSGPTARSVITAYLVHAT